MADAIETRLAGDSIRATSERVAILAAVAHLLAVVAGSSGSSSGVAIVAIVAGAFVGLTGSFVAIRTQRSQLAFQRGETDRAEIKAILDTIMENIYRAQMAISELEAIAFYAGNEADPSVRWTLEAPSYASRLDENRLTLLSELNRLGLRLGAAADPMVDEVAAAGNVVQAVQTMALSKIGIHARLAEEHEAIQQRRIGFSEHARQFTRAELAA